MLRSLARFLRGERGATLGFSAILLLLAAGIFVFLSNTSCEPGGGGGCNGSNPPTGMGGSELVAQQSVNKGGSTPYLGGSTGPYLQGELVQRDLGYSGLASVSRMVWTPPEGAANFEFGVGITPEPGGPPYVFLNPPPLFSVGFDMPTLPAGVDTLRLSESLRIEGADGSSSQAGMVASLYRTPQAPIQPQQAEGRPSADASSQAVTAYQVDKWRYMDDDVMTTAQCQDIFDMLQGGGAFAALRVPMVPSAQGASYQIPVISGPDASSRPMMDFTAGWEAVSGIPNLPLELLPDRMTYLENNLPSASGEAWIAMGVSSDTPVTCPADMNKTGWEFHFRYFLDLVGQAEELPAYYCYEGNTSPLAAAAARMMAGAGAASVQAGGITCMGPQDQVLEPNASLELGNPGSLWNVLPPEEIALEHYINLDAVFPVNLSASSSLSGVTWTFYRGDNSAPNLTQPIANPWTPANSFEFFWLVGTLPAGTPAGSYAVTITAAKVGDPSTSAHITDLVWVGEWVPPNGTLPVFLPFVMK
jgi:hypothetical protein